MMKSKRLLLLLLMALIAPLAMHAQQSLPYNYGFEDANLATDGWSSTATSGSSKIYSGDAHSGSLFYAFYYSDEDSYLMSPILTGGTNGIELSFFYKAYSSSYPDHFKVGYTTDATVTDPSEFTYGAQVTSSSDWQEYTATLPAGTVRVAVWYDEGNYDDGWYLFLDDFSFEAPSSCTKPQNLVVGTIGKRSVTLSWDEMGDTREWQVCLNGDESNPIPANSNDNFVLDGLDPETTYTVKVRSYCSADSQSNWTAEVSFTTLEACPAPTVTVTPTPTSATVTCTSDASSYNLRYAIPTPDPTQPATIILTVGDVWGDGSGYQMLLDADATAYGDIIPETGGLTSSGDVSADVYAQFEYKIPVNADGSLTTSNIVINNTITLQIPAGTYDWCITNPTPGDRMWIASSGGNVGGRQDDYEFLGGFVYEFVITLDEESGNDRVDLTLGYNGPWIEEVPEVTSPVTLPVFGDPLTPETQYIVQVQALCGGEDGSSDWTSVFFTTPSNCDAPIELTAEATATGATLEWTGYQESFNIQYRTAAFDGYYINEPLTPDNMGDWGSLYADDNSGFYYTDDTQTDVYWAFYYNDNPPQYLFSPDFPRPTQQTETLTFDYKIRSTSYPETFQLLYFVGDDVVAEDAVTVTNTDWEQYTSEVPVGATSFVIAYLSDDMYVLYLDNFVIYDEDEIVAEDGPWMSTTATEMTATITGLEPGTWYEWQVQGVNESCDLGLTDWSASAYFTTLPAADEVTQTVELVEGWNWFSTYIELEDPIELLEMLEEGLGDSGIQIESVVDGVNMNAGDMWVGDLMSIGLMNEHMYMIEVTEAVTFELQGPATNPEAHPITIYPGDWSWIGFPCAEEVDVNVALADFPAEDGDMIESIDDGMIFYDSESGIWVGDFDTMIPGRGYMYLYNGSDEQTLVFQTGGEAKAKHANSLNVNNILKGMAKKISKIKMNPNLSDSKMESKANQLAKSKYCNEIKQLKLFKK